jgi:hypothetical protein
MITNYGLIGNIDYGSWKDGSSIFKDKKGYYIIQAKNKGKGEAYKKYLKNWKPPPDTKLLYLDKTKKKWTFIKPKKNNTTNTKTKKYNDIPTTPLRPSPTSSANKNCGKTMKGNDGNMYISKPNKNGICRWQKNKTIKIHKKLYK